EDEVAPLPLHHRANHRGGQPVGADQVDLDLRFETVRADFVQPAEIRVARPGDQQLDVTEFLGGTVHESLDRLRIGDIQRERYRLAAVGADLVDVLLALLDASGAQRNGKAMGGKLDGRRGTDARRRTGLD